VPYHLGCYGQSRHPVRRRGVARARHASQSHQHHQNDQNHQNRSPGQPMLIMTIDLLPDACRTQ